METFLQILDLDEDSDHEFSRDMVEAYFAQAATTFEDMASAISSADLTKLSELGHFLKGSSAALGVFKVQASCEKIQNFGKNQDQDTDRSLTDAEALKMITGLMPTVKRDFADAEKWLKNWYEKNCTPEP
ncbi:histidine-phosphotransfer domain, HPT domain-containing protein [Fistulina hepatica ATCC 64428]|uniref:Histidine-phosphotransfer domain, HPT domain-containing protein n=1 Tax=Fistulina hepatica ATCC 64428 TaxID=1128425 RepID=A0A0D7A6L4_9AGAR|nr:histidine-phosphotransfer domain, HPT domain-containing protein [Fistulina hepatica ATCC 64428]